MKLILKIAIGVFLGSIAAYVALNVPGWMRQSQEEKGRLGGRTKRAQPLSSRGKND
jgi:hypothetical protein